MMPDVRALIRRDLVPVLRSREFRGSLPTLRRPVGDTIQVVNVQASSGNGPNWWAFYLNCSIYVPELDQLVNHHTLAKPREESCQLRERAEPSDPTARGRYEFTPEGDSEATMAGAVADLSGMLDYLDRFVTVEDVVAELAQRWLASFPEVIAWYLSTDQIHSARAFATRVWERFGDEDRWPTLARLMDEAAALVGVAPGWRAESTRGSS
ncbi:MAG: DUF4304 domain-containing protein [Propioniciclava sp.]